MRGEAPWEPGKTDGEQNPELESKENELQEEGNGILF